MLPEVKYQPQHKCGSLFYLAQMAAQPTSCVAELIDVHCLQGPLGLENVSPRDSEYMRDYRNMLDHFRQESKTVLPPSSTWIFHQPQTIPRSSPGFALGSRQYCTTRIGSRSKAESGIDKWDAKSWGGNTVTRHAVDGIQTLPADSCQTGA